MVKHLLSNVGVDAALRLLKAHPAVLARVPAALYEHFLLARQEASRRDRLAHGMLTALDSYLWVRRAPLLPPQFRHVRDVEQRCGPQATRARRGALWR